MKKTIMLPFLALFLIPLGCSTQAENVGELKYEETKKMVTDILKTDEGKQTVKELLADEQFKTSFIMDNQTVTKAIEDTLVSNKGKEFWKKAFEDPAFAETFAKSMRTETEKLLKSLMKDPEYRGMMMEVLRDPEMEKELSDLMKSNEYREHLKQLITETMESPLFQAKLQDLIIRSAESIRKENQDGASNNTQ
ncbi:spore germination lipoprotein GerD [Caldibacillus debilis]|uniref:spore germination lipoprotein GerD n=1 Tax=Caldibacillus debilis TaxID=301148 RepID=UPI00036F8F40|nr:spore germination lipoprotein GerD [Caldibacillus debilis]